MTKQQEGRIAPHWLNEVGLVLGGVKPLASIERRKNEEGFVKACLLKQAGVFRGTVTPTADDPSGEIVFTLPATADLLDVYAWLLEHGVAELGLKDYHRQMGRLYGYDEADIEEFVNNEIDCNCEKCSGGLTS